ncbi:MAG: hypothetical protein ACHQUC_03500 [Chlamydiales bacterium]
MANLTPFPVVAFTAPTDIDEALKSPAILTLVDARVSTYQSINVAEAMGNLVKVGDLLSLPILEVKAFLAVLKLWEC